VDELSSRIPDAEEISSVVKEIESLRSFAESERREINERISQLSSSLLEIKRMRKELDELSEELTGLMKVIGTGEETIKKLETDLRSQILKLSSRIDFLSREESLEELLRERELILERMRRAK
jgi:septal ring factor EnvC (AmiA/AmiB activator)